jgi:hypothetical protein
MSNLKKKSYLNSVHVSKTVFLKKVQICKKSQI